MSDPPSNGSAGSAPAERQSSKRAPRDTGYRQNQWPAGVTMVQIKRRFAALRVRSTVELRTVADAPFERLDIRALGRARRPWVLRAELADGSVTYLRPFLPGEAGLPDCGTRVGGIGDSPSVGNDPLSALIAVVAIVFYVLASPFFIAATVRRTKAAKRLLGELEAAAT